ncbi:MAG: GAF domain-containing protein [Anaerolineales bacterium]|nr:GAF domain-containing protein [Anaerolineales bacterium]
MNNNHSTQISSALLGRVKMQEEIHQLQQKVDYLTKLHKIGELLSKTFDLDEILTQVVQEAISITSAEEGLLILIDEETNELVLRAQQGFQEDFVQRQKKSVTDILARECISTKKSLRLTNKDRTLSRVTGYYVSSVVYVPLLVDDKVVGVLSVDNRNLEKTFTESDEFLLNILANYAGIAIRNAYLVDNLRTRADVLSSLHDTGKSILSVSLLREVLEQIANEVFRLLKADSIVLYEYSYQDDDITVPPIIRGNLNNEERLKNKSPNHKQSSVFKLIKNGQPFYASDAQNDWVQNGLVGLDYKEDDSFLIREEIISSAGIPLIANEETVGLIFINYINKKTFQDSDKEFIELLANQAAIAIQNARLLEVKDSNITELKKLVETSRDVTFSHTKFKNVLQVVADHTRNVVDANYAFVYPIDTKTGEFRDDLVTFSGEINDDLRVHAPRHGGITELVKKERIVIIEDTHNIQKYPFIGQDPDSFIVRYNIKTVIGIALWSGSDFIGVLYADFLESKKLSEDKKQILQLYANQAAVSIQNAYRFDQKNQHNRELSILNKIGQILSANESQGIDYLLRNIYEHTKLLMEVDNFYVAIYDEDLNKVSFKFAVEKGILQKLNEGDWKDRTDGNGLTEYIIQNKAPILIPKDIEKWLSDNGVNKLGPDAKSWLGVPMLASNNKVLGVISIQSYDKENAYDEHHQDILFTIAGQASIAIQNANLFDEKIREIEALNNAYTAILSKHEIDEVLKSIIDKFATLTKCEAFLIRLYDSKKEDLVLREHRGNIEGKIPKRININSESISARAAKFKKIIICDDVQKDTLRQSFVNSINDPEERRYLFWSQSQAAVPLIVKEKLIGVMIAQSHSKSGIIDTEAQVLESFANTVAIAIENASLFEEIKHRALQLSIAAQVARDATRTLDIKNLLNQTVNLISQRFEFYHVGIFLLDNKFEFAVLQAASSEGGKLMLKEGYKLNKGIVGFVAHNGKPRIADNVEMDEEFYNNRYLPNTRSEMALPLTVNGQVIGVLDVQSTESDIFTDDDKDVLQILADQLSNAIENARQYIELEQTRGIVLARTALAWMGMANSDLRHAIGNDIAAIDDYVVHARKDISKNAPIEKILERLDRITEIVSKIQKVPITAPLYDEEVVRPIILHEMVEERINQLLMREQYRDISCKLNFESGSSVSVRADPDWLRRAFDILIDNSVNAMSEAVKKQLLITISLENKGIALTINDNGRGIPNDLLPFLFNAKIPKVNGSKGLGMGLLMADLIVQLYEGKLELVSTGPYGTIMKIWLPMAIRNVH